MSLDWNWPEGEQHDDLGWVVEQTKRGPRNAVAPVTEAVVFSTMYVGVRVLDSSTIETFIDRVVRWEAAAGPFLIAFDDEEIKPRPLTPEEMRCHLGLSTNASPMGVRAFEKALSRARGMADSAPTGGQ